MEFNSELLSCTETNNNETKLVQHCSKHQDIQLVDEIFFNASCLSLVNYEKMSENRQAIIGFFMANLRLREKKKKKKKHCCLSW